MQFLLLLKQGILAILLDVDGAVYMTSAIEDLPSNQQRKAIQWGLFTEFLGRVALIILVYSLLSENRPLFTFLGIEFTPDSISLFIAGAFLLFKNGTELYEFIITRQDEARQLQFPQVSFFRLMFEITVVNLILSIDTLIVLLTRKLTVSSIIFLFVFSAIIRLFLIDKMARFIRNYPSVKIIIFMFLILIGFELFLEGFWFSFPEEIFNTLMILAIIATFFHHSRTTQN